MRDFLALAALLALAVTAMAGDVYRPSTSSTGGLDLRITGGHVEGSITRTAPWPGEGHPWPPLVRITCRVPVLENAMFPGLLRQCLADAPLDVEEWSCGVAKCWAGEVEP